MTQSDKNNFEKRTQLKEWYGIVLYKEGNFFRAYNQSAWLLSHFVYKPENPNQGLKVTKYNTKNSGDFIVCGFPIGSVEKFVPNMTLVAKQDGNLFLGQMKTDAIDEKYRNADILAAEYEKFFKSVAVTENNKPKNKEDKKSHEPVDTFSLMRAIFKFPIESKTPMECLAFVSDLKTMVSKLL